MKRVRGLVVLGALLLMGVLSGCGMNLGLGDPLYRVQFDPVSFGYEVTQDGIQVVSNQARVHVTPGAPGGWLEGYEITYLDPDGNVIRGQPNGLGDAKVRIPPGYVCTETPAETCTLSSPDVAFAPNASDWFTGISLDADIVNLHLDAVNNGAASINWRAVITFTARTDTGQTVTWTQTVRILYPLSQGQ
ncbi:hypothetical protein [Marinithermus hydrothermalis]|uniref:Lipoprotein n=1 Tax=Marinithermus hydrothermalis (strain DSM 14884 / JCM 11576 / T1) TaxID=869210 RepID=F2NM85_MARHT|nr:hypothetical protein [Marinithermus hydrothermalis]AEB11555.1 hypothetical protein Marky_0808 [Marinithermus hydrothermalis DSM 14884]